MNRFLIFVLALCSGALFGCTDSTPTKPGSDSAVSRSVFQLEEQGLLAAVGRPPAYEYSLNDGRGLNFRAKHGEPDFKLEFRAGRTNVAWMQFGDDTAKFGAMNAENLQWADQVLTHALGKEAANRILESVASNKPLVFEHHGHRVSVSPGSMQSLVSIKH